MKKLPYLLFITLFALFLFHVLTPMIGLMIPSDSFRLNLDTTAVGLAALLIFMSFALVLIERIPPSSRLRMLKLSTGGIEAKFEEIREMAAEISTEEPPREVRNEIRQIRQTDREGNPTGIFLELVIEIEKKLHLLSRKPEESWKFTSVPRIVDLLVQNEVIDRNLAELIRGFWNLRNQVVHGRINITEELLDDAISAGEVILSQLEESFRRNST